MVHSNQLTVPGNSDREYFPLVSLDSGTAVPRSGRNIDNRTGMNPQVPIVTTISESNSVSNWNIFNFIRGKSDISYRFSLWHGAATSENESLGGKNIFEDAEHKNNIEVGNLGAKIL